MANTNRTTVYDTETAAVMLRDELHLLHERSQITEHAADAVIDAFTDGGVDGVREVFHGTRTAGDPLGLGLHEISWSAIADIVDLLHVIETGRMR